MNADQSTTKPPAMKPIPTTEERIWAVLSHLSTLAFGLGIILPILGWSEQRRKSKYASFQCLQALGYQSLGYTIWLLSYLLLVILFVVVLVILLGFEDQNARSSGPTSMFWPGMFVLAVFGWFALYLLFPVLAAIACAQGKEFRYPILGKRLAVYLGYSEESGLNKEHEERWVASMGHFSVIIALCGMLAPAATWILQGRQSAFLKFQSIQTTIYQASVNLMYLFAGVVYFFGIVVVAAVFGVGGDPGSESPAGLIAIGLFFLSLIAAALIMLALPLFHILGQWAGYRLLKGDNYRYPIIGRQVEKRLK